jgi:hypothetical protein
MNSTFSGGHGQLYFSLHVTKEIIWEVNYVKVAQVKSYTFPLMNKHDIILTHYVYCINLIESHGMYHYKAVPQLRQLVTSFSLWKPGFTPRAVYVKFVVDTGTGKGQNFH